MTTFVLERWSLFFIVGRKQPLDLRIYAGRGKIKEVAILFSSESEILRKMRLIEWLKADLITQMGNLYQVMAKNSEQATRESLAAIIVGCYVLAGRLGIRYDSLDQEVLKTVEKNIKNEHEVEKWFGDFSEMKRHLSTKR